MAENLRDTKLDPLFERWLDHYPPSRRAAFHRDGAVDESKYWAESHRVLFVMAEPNSVGGAYDRYWGWDLRVVLGRERLAKEFNLNLGLWVRCLLDGETQYARLGADEAQLEIRRVAVMNLKKLGGKGDVELATLGRVAMSDRQFILEEIDSLDPHLIITSGPKANRVLGWVSTGDREHKVSDDMSWRHSGRSVLPGNSPSLRPYQAEKVFARLVDRATRARVTSFGAPDTPAR